MTQDKVKQLVIDLIDESAHKWINWNRWKQDIVDITTEIVELAAMIESKCEEDNQGYLEQKKGEQ